ncbi:MAG: Maf family protein [Candidatus Malihini olakiniferum]
MLAALSGRQHQGDDLGYVGRDRRATYSTLVVTDVTFLTLTPQDIARYITSGELIDKAGAYGIQSKDGFFVKAITGSYHVVVGLPLVKT